MNFPPFIRSSQTSRAAAVAIAPTASTARGRVLAAIRQSQDGMTDEEIQVQLEMNPSTQRPRRIELVGMGLIKDSGRRRLTNTRRQAVVWEQIV